MTLPNKATYLHAAKRNQLALLVTTTKLELSAEWSKRLCGSSLYKKHTRYVLLNCNYLKLENESRARAGLEPLKKVAPLPWGEWAINGVLIRHSPKDADGEARYYLRYYPDAEVAAESVEYRVEDVIVSAEEAKEMMRPRPDSHSSVCRVVEWDNIDELYLCDGNGEICTTVK